MKLRLSYSNKVAWGRDKSLPPRKASPQKHVRDIDYLNALAISVTRRVPRMLHQFYPLSDFYIISDPNSSTGDRNSSVK